MQVITKFDKLQKLRKKVFERYKKNLNGFELIESDAKHTSSHHKCVLLVSNRDGLAEHLADNGIETKIHYRQTLDITGSYVSAESICKRALSLPIYPFLNNSEIDYVCKMVRKFYDV